MTADLPDRAAGDRERECTCCPPGKRPAIEHAKGCPRRAPRTVPLSWGSVGEEIAALAARPAPDDSGACIVCGYDRAAHQGDGEMVHDFAPPSPQPGEALKAALVRALPEAFGWARWDPRSVDCAADALLSGPLAGLLAADTARAQAEEQVTRVRELAEAWEQRAEAYSAADDRDKVTELRQRAAALRRALDGEQ